jgi:hypothetical protein
VIKISDHPEVWINPAAVAMVRAFSPEAPGSGCYVHLVNDAQGIFTHIDIGEVVAQIDDRPIPPKPEHVDMSDPTVHRKRVGEPPE